MSTKLIPYEALVAKGIAISKLQLWRNERAGKFPKRVSISHKQIAWVEDEIDQFLADRIAARQPA